MTTALIPINYDGEQPTVSARALHTGLGIRKRFSTWFDTNSQGFVENEDYTSVLSGTVVNNGAHREIQDYSLSVDMAKHICLMSRTERVCIVFLPLRPVESRGFCILMSQIFTKRFFTVEKKEDE